MCVICDSVIFVCGSSSCCVTGEVCHGSELCFVFDVFTDGVTVSYTPTEDEDTLTSDLANGWTNFITNGNPNTGLPIAKQYSTYAESSDMLLDLNEPGTHLEANVRSSYCDMWDRLGYFY